MSNRDQTGGRERGNRSHERLPAFGAIAVSAAGASAPRGTPGSEGASAEQRLCLQGSC